MTRTLLRRTHATGMAAVMLAGAVAGPAGATGTGGTDILHVPMAWCAVNGSPAQAAPNVTSEGTTMADTDTDAVLWRRHERPTDNVFLPQATVSLRSAITDSWGTFNFPLINDPATTVGNPGDIVSNSTEETSVINACDARYDALGRTGIGITAVNINLFREADGSFGGQAGLGGCSYTGAPGSPCVSDFFIIVADNRWFYPTVPNRNIAGWGTPMADPLDLLVAHEVGHALTLPHRTNNAALMNPGLRDNNGDGRLDNTQLNTAEINLLRQTANNVPGLEIDPPAVFIPGRVLAMRVMDDRGDRIPRGLDLAAVGAELNTKTERVHLTQRLWGLLPCRSRVTSRFDYVADLDDESETGAGADDLKRLGLDTDARGGELLARVTITGGRRKGRDFRNCHASVRAWTVDDGEVREVSSRSVQARIRTLRMWRTFTAPEGKKPELPRKLFDDVFNTIDLSIRNAVLPTRVRPESPFRVFTRTRDRRGERDSAGKRGNRLILEHPRFPHCFPAGPGAPGGTVEITYDGLQPGQEIHALLGPIEVLRGPRADQSGQGTIALPIPEDTQPGNHLVTIGHDKMALTADCTVAVQRG